MFKILWMDEKYQMEFLNECKTEQLFCGIFKKKIIRHSILLTDIIEGKITAFRPQGMSRQTLKITI